MTKKLNIDAMWDLYGEKYSILEGRDGKFRLTAHGNKLPVDLVLPPELPLFADGKCLDPLEFLPDRQGIIAEFLHDEQKQANLSYLYGRFFYNGALRMPEFHVANYLDLDNYDLDILIVRQWDKRRAWQSDSLHAYMKNPMSNDYTGYSFLIPEELRKIGNPPHAVAQPDGSHTTTDTPNQKYGVPSEYTFWIMGGNAYAGQEVFVYKIERIPSLREDLRRHQQLWAEVIQQSDRVLQRFADEKDIYRQYMERLLQLNVIGLNHFVPKDDHIVYRYTSSPGYNHENTFRFDSIGILDLASLINKTSKMASYSATTEIILACSEEIQRHRASHAE